MDPAISSTATILREPPGLAFDQGPKLWSGGRRQRDLRFEQRGGFGGGEYSLHQRALQAAGWAGGPNRPGLDRPAGRGPGRVREWLTLKHHFEFNGPSFASPLIVGNDIYFDGVDAGGTKIIKIRDTGTSFEEQLRVPVATSPRASFALDPRADSFWHPVYNRVVRRSLNDLSHMGVIDVEGLIDDQDSTNFRVGVLTIAGDAASPVLLTTASQFEDEITYVVAFDLMNGQLLWKVKFGGITEPGLAYDRVLSQFPILTDSGGANPRVIFTGGRSNAPGGVYAVGVP